MKWNQDAPEQTRIELASGLKKTWGELRTIKFNMDAEFVRELEQKLAAMNPLLISHMKVF